MGEVLKPCPFCGGRAEMILDEAFPYVECENCHCDTDWMKTEEQAFETWNTRVERTAKVEDVVVLHSEELNMSLVDKVCSWCGYKFGRETARLNKETLEVYETNNTAIPNYCPDCGAKVVE